MRPIAKAGESSEYAVLAPSPSGSFPDNPFPAILHETRSREQRADAAAPIAEQGNANHRASSFGAIVPRSEVGCAGLSLERSP